MAPPSLVDVDQVNKLSSRLETIARYLPPEDPLSPAPGRKNAPSFLFEIKVLLDLLDVLSTSGWSIVTTYREGRIRLVRAAAAKSMGSFFTITRGGSQFQIAQGTKILDIHDESRAPDISLQRKDSGDEPTYRDVLAIWDAKLRGQTGQTTKTRISDPEFRSFVLVRKWLKAPCSTFDDIPADWPPAFRVCALISNGRSPSEPESVFIEGCISVVQKYEGANSEPWPSLQQHTAAQNRQPAAEFSTDFDAGTA